MGQTETKKEFIKISLQNFRSFYSRFDKSLLSFRCRSIRIKEVKNGIYIYTVYKSKCNYGQIYFY